MVCDRGVQGLGRNRRHVAGDAVVGRTCLLPLVFIGGAPARVVRTVTVLAEPAVVSGTIGDGRRRMRIVAGDACQRVGRLVTAAQHQLFGVAHDLHLLTGIGRSVIVLKVLNRLSGTVVGQAPAARIDVGPGLEMALVTDRLGAIPVQSGGIDDRSVEPRPVLVRPVGRCPIVPGDVKRPGPVAAFTADRQFVDSDTVIAVVDGRGPSGVAEQAARGGFTLEAEVVWRVVTG